jgi:mandelate racemase
LQQPFTIKDGYLEIPNLPGAGIEWNEGAVTRYRYDA